MINAISHTEDKSSILQSELYRCRTTENAAAHALDTLRQDLGLQLIDGEHPMDTVERIKKKINGV